MSKNNKRKVQLAESESLKKKYRRLKVKEKTGMSLSTYEKLNDAIKEVEKGNYDEYEHIPSDYLYKGWC